MKIFDRFKGLRLSVIKEAISTRRLKTYFSQKIKQRIKQIQERFPKNLNELKELSPEELFSRITSGKATGTYFRMLIVAGAAYYLADTVSLFTDALVPEPPAVPPVNVVKKQDKIRSIDEYSAILSRNIFSSKNLVPDDDGEGGPARKSQLPLNLVGTMVLEDEVKSIAAIEDKSQNMIYPIRLDDTISGLARITKIERLRVYFVNQSTGRNEYIEIIDDVPRLNISAAAPPVLKGKTKDGVTQTSDTHFEIDKNTIEKSLSNIGEILQQARAIPNFENGMQDGYRLVEIKQGSFYQQIGLHDNDVICGVNGEPMNDPTKAFALFNELRTIQKLELCVKRNGKKTVMNYEVR